MARYKKDDRIADLQAENKRLAEECSIMWKALMAIEGSAATNLAAQIIARAALDKLPKFGR